MIMKRILSATALALAFAGANVVSEPLPEATVQPPAAVAEKPVDCCGDNCQCCEGCECSGDCGGGVDAGVDLQVQPVEPTKTLPKSPRKLGELRMINGQQHKLINSWQIDGMWSHRYEPVASAAVSSVATQPASGYYSGTSQWTYPGRIDNHLMSAHGVSQSQLSGMNKQEQERLHDSLHNGAVRQPVYRQPVYRQPVRSSCPGGVCPTPARRGFFR
jgi:hypothetical protein